MGIFTIVQSQAGKSIYLYPEGDLSGCTDFAAVGDNPNWRCVDEDRHTPDDDATYVWWAGVSSATDLYVLPNHTTETGTINYVQVYARTKAHQTAQAETGVYKIVCSPDSICSHLYKSDHKNLVTNYTTYSKVWTKNPADLNAWEWSDIDLLCPGVECSSPSIPGEAINLTSRPNGPGVQTECTPFGDAPNWKCVDEAVADEDTTYNYTTSAATKKDLFNLQNHTTETEVITGITLYARYRKTGAAISTAFKWWIYTNGGLHDAGFGTYPPDAYATFSKTLATNPITGNPWTWAEIDALQAGYIIHNDTTETRVTQYYVVVHYSKIDVNPEIRTTQCYAKVNYDGESTECALNSPDHISTNHARNVKMLNFWNGEREVYDLNRSGKSMVLTGEITDRGDTSETWCDTDYAFRRKLAIDHTQVDSALSDFPVYVHTNLNRKCLNTNGYDIMLCDSSCSEYKCDIEHYDSGTGDMKLWVKIPTLSSTADTVLWLYYRKSGVTINPSTTEVWDDAGYGMVQHMTDEDVTRDTIKGSTDAGHIGTKGGANEPTEINTVLHKGQRGDGVNDVVEVPANNADLNLEQENWTISFWIKTNSTQGNRTQDIICKNKDAGTGWVLIRHGRIGWFDGIWMQCYQDALNYFDFESISPQLSDGEWHLVHYVVDKGETGRDRAKFYWDGAFHHVAHHYVGNPNLTSVDNIRMWKGTLSGTGYYWDGQLDELRWAKGKVCSAAWCDAEYNNQKPDSTFITYGRQQENYVDIINACGQIICVRDMARNGSIVTINKLVPLYFSGDYRINSFGWDKVSSKPENYRWILELEDAD